MSQKKRYAWVLSLVRYGLLAAAIVFLCFNVKWYDYATLSGEEKTPVRIVSRNADAHEIVVMRDGAETTLSEDAFVREEVSGEVAVQQGVKSVAQTADWRWALLALIVIAPWPLFQAWRLLLMLRIQDINLRYFDAAKLTYAGNFFNFALPGTTGGDVFKAYYLTKYTHHKTEAVTTVFLDRAIGMVALLSLSGAMLLVHREIAHYETYVIVLSAIGAMLLTGAIVVFSGRLRQMLHLRELLELMPASGHLMRIGQAVVAMRRHPLRLVGAFFLALILQSLIFVAVVIMSRSLGMDGKLMHYLVCIPLGFMIAAIPLSPPQGFGVMEGAFVLFFTTGGLNNSPSQAVALALSARLLQLIWSLPGALAPLLGVHVPKQEELKRFEAEEENGVASVPVGESVFPESEAVSS